MTKELATVIYQDSILRIKELYTKTDIEMVHAGIAVEVGSNLAIRDDYQ